MSPPSKEAEPQPSLEELEAARELVRQARARGVALTGPDGLVKALTKTVIETALEEMSEHLGYDKHDLAGRNLANSPGGQGTWAFPDRAGRHEMPVPGHPVAGPQRPRAPAEARPAMVRSEMSSRSSSARAAQIPKTSFPAAVVVSMAAPCPVSTLSPTRRAVRS